MSPNGQRPGSPLRGVRDDKHTDLRAVIDLASSALSRFLKTKQEVALTRIIG
jgi:hypothetical protein